MPAMAAITINDGKATPVAHVFGPGPLVGANASFFDRSTGISIGYPSLTIVSSQPSKTSNLYKTRVKIVMPVLEVVNASTYNGITPSPTKAYDLTFDCTIFCPQRATLADRKDILALAKNALSHATISSIVVDQEVIY